MRIPRAVATAAVLLVVLAGTLYYSQYANANAGNVTALVQTTGYQGYCIYSQQFLVTMVQVNPQTTEQGAVIEVVFKVEYLDGTPATLNPELADFLILSSAYSRIYQRIPVDPTGEPGVYETTLTLSSDIPPGTYKLYCIHCTLSDGRGNGGPNTDTSSDETFIGTDISLFGVQAAVTQAQPPPPPTNLTLLIGLFITLLILALIALLLLRRRRKK